jgi:putative endonuclease
MVEPSQVKLRSSIRGQQGENLVAQWLQQQHWSILTRGWTSRWGELDIVALRREGRHANLAFVEVKTRSQGNWDENGLYAITRSKQSKLWKTAQQFLAQHPYLGEANCRFDVALVSVRRSPLKKISIPTPKIFLGQPIIIDGEELILHTYLESAFELSD